MGQSPSADLFYGYDLKDLTDPDSYDDLHPAWMGGEDENGEERPEVDADEHLASKLGWVEVPFPDGIPETNYSLSREARQAAQQAIEERPDYRAWADNRSEMRRLVADSTVDLHWYGYLEEPSHCVRVIASVQHAWDWGSIELTPLVVDPAWDAQIAEYMRLMELPIPAGKSPGWHMNCSYG